MELPIAPAAGAGIEAALLAFQTSPGRFPIARREPRLLFDQAHAVLLLATGRLQATGDGHEAAPEVVQQAARFFVRHAFLRPGADHYVLLGLSPTANAQAVREHYRLLIRLTHPDFATPQDRWPPDAAVRVNLAHDVLSVPDKRSEYDTLQQRLPAPSAQRAAQAPQPARDGRPSAFPVPARGTARLQHAWAGKRKTSLSVGLAVFAAGSMALFLWATPHEEQSLKASVAAASGQPTATAQRLLQEARQFEQTLASLSTPPAVPLLQPLPQPVAEEVIAPAPGEEAAVRQPVLPAMPAKTTAAAPAPAIGAEPGRQDISIADNSTEATPIKTGISIALSQPPVVVDTVEAPAARAAPNLPTAPALANSMRAQATPTEKVAAPAELNMQQVQPMLTELVVALQSGQVEQVRQWADRMAPHSGSAARFSEAYRAAVGGARVTGLGQVKFTLRPPANSRQVSGLVQLQLLDASQQVNTRNFRMRAHFGEQAGRLKLTALEAE